MEKQFAILAVLLIGVFLAGCAPQTQSGYATYNQPQGQGGGQQGQYVGGGCGVAPMQDYRDTDVDSLGNTKSGL